MEKSAVEWLEFRYKNNINLMDYDFEQAKEIEKQQKGYSEEDLKKAYLDGCEIKLTNTYHLNKWFEQFKHK